MPELIDKRAAYNALKHEAETHELSFSAEAYDRAARIIDQMHTIEPEVRHGRWVFLEQKSGYLWKCSNCKGNSDQRFSYCPYYGAKMGGALTMAVQNRLKRSEAMKRTDLQSPCKDCADRHDLCHSTCERYQQYSANRKALSKWQRDLSTADSMDATRGERIHRKMRRKLGGTNK